MVDRGAHPGTGAAGDEVVPEERGDQAVRGGDQEWLVLI